MVSLFLVEDEVVMRDGIKKHIDWEKEGIEFVGDASDGELAYPQIIEKKPDIVVTDIKMPFMDGLELSELVKKELPNTQIIILSGYDEFSYAQKAISLGATEYLLKPISPAKLLECIKKVAGKIEKEKNNIAIQKFFGALANGEISASKIMDMTREKEKIPLEETPAEQKDIRESDRKADKDKNYSHSVRKALSFIDENYDNEDISLNMVASEVNLSPNHFSALFSQEVGTPFIEYLINKRMEKAKILLSSTDMKTFEIAYEVGYKDPHYFSSTFKKTQGMTTKEYRASNR